jgi:RNA polymerase sigma-70 factor (ECF subfamily)
MMDLTTKTDRELIDAYADGFRESAFAELVRRHEGMVHATCRRITGSEHDAEDLTQVVFALFADRAAALDARVSPAGWLSRTAWHVATRMRRDVQRRRRREHSAAMGAPVYRQVDLDAYEIPQALSEALEELSQPHREIIALYHLAGFTLPQIAEMTGVPIGTVAGRLSRARMQLRFRLSQRGLDLMSVGLPEVLILEAMLCPTGEQGVGAATVEGAKLSAGVVLHAQAPMPVFTAVVASSAPAAATSFGAMLGTICTVPILAAISLVTVGTAGGAWYFEPTAPAPRQLGVPVVGAYEPERNPNKPYGGGSSNSSIYTTVPEPGTLTIVGGTIVMMGVLRPRRVGNTASSAQ